MLERMTYETRATLESMCHGVMYSLEVDDMWGLFDSFAWHQWHHEIASDSFVRPSLISYDLHDYLSLMCSYCQSFDHDVNFYCYYGISNACYTKLYATIETMNDRHECFIGKMREYGLLHETNPSSSFPRHKVSLYNDYKSSLPVEPILMIDSLA